MENVTKILFMNRSSLSIIAILSILIIINLPPLKFLWGTDDCQYANAKGSFTFDEVNFQGRDYAMCIRRFQHFKANQAADTTLYRLCSINILYVWKYGDYLLNKKYRLTYKPWQEIETRRGTIINKSGFQDF